jgi:DNA-binding response OmpR family regulator
VGITSNPAGKPSQRPRPVELHAQLKDSQTEGKRTTFELELAHIVVPTAAPLPPGSLITVNLRLSAMAPAVTSLARVVTVEPGATPNDPSLMRLCFLDVWGKQAADQLTQYIHEAVSGSAEDEGYLSSVRVLVVDDSPHYRDLAADIMREAGFEVFTACNGFEGLSAALKHQPSVVLSDITMPGMDGWQLLRMIRARPTLKRMPVIFLSELTNEEQRLRGYELGVDDHVGKPFTAVELIARVERVLERAHAAGDLSNDMRGDLAKIPVTSLLSFAELERRTGVLQLERDGERATLHLRDGAVMRIDLGSPYDSLQGVERVFHVLEWTSGRFELVSTSVTVEDSLNVPTSFALLEHARRRDESML